MIKAMLDLTREVFRQETLATDKARARGCKVIRPTSLLLVIIGIFYTLSGIDIVPEVIVKPRIFGVIDDLLVLTFVGVFIYSDIGGIISYATKEISKDNAIKVPVREVPKPKEVVRKIEVHNEDETPGHDIDDTTASTCIDTDNTEIPNTRDNTDNDSGNSSSAIDSATLFELYANIGIEPDTIEKLIEDGERAGDSSDSGSRALGGEEGYKDGDDPF